MADEFTKAALYGIKTFNEKIKEKVKEKIGMEKLIELLNEYNKIHNYAPIEYYDDGEDGFETDYVAYYKTCILISKSFGFIKWLVENDKIDREQKTKEFRLQIELDNGSYGELGGEARLLMLLSISDTPIEDLISYLK